MGIETLLRPSLLPCPRQPKVKPEVIAKVQRSVGWKGSNFQIFHQDRLHADLKSAFRCDTVPEIFQFEGFSPEISFCEKFVDLSLIRSSWVLSVCRLFFLEKMSLGVVLAVCTHNWVSDLPGVCEEYAIFVDWMLDVLVQADCCLSFVQVLLPRSWYWSGSSSCWWNRLESSIYRWIGRS